MMNLHQFIGNRVFAPPVHELAQQYPKQTLRFLYSNAAWSSVETDLEIALQESDITGVHHARLSVPAAEILAGHLTDIALGFGIDRDRYALDTYPDE